MMKQVLKRIKKTALLDRANDNSPLQPIHNACRGELLFARMHKWGGGVSLLLLLFLTACADADRSADSAVPGEQFVITVGGIREGAAASQTRTEAKPATVAFAETSGGVYINASFAETDDAATTRAGGTTSMAVGTTFRVVAFRYPIATGEVAGQAEYTVAASGVSSSAPLSLGAGAYAIIAYSYNNSTAIPALTGTGSSFSLTAGKDFLFSPATDVYLEEGATSTALKLIFDRQMARVCVKLDASAVGGVKITNPGTVQVVGLPSSGKISLRSGKLTAVASSSATDCTFATTQGATLTGNELYVFPCSASLSLSLEGSVVEGFLPLTTAVQLGGMTLTAGVSYTLTANLCDVLSGANCYVLPAAGTYYMDATIKGNGKVVDVPADISSETAAYATRVPEDGVTTIPASSIASAAVLWETVNTPSAPTAGTIVSNVSVSNGIVTFSTGSTEGNAVIAVKNSAGTILWSWHIWRTNGTLAPAILNEIKATDGTVIAKTGALAMMNRNLGALSNVDYTTDATKGNLSAGLFYQWGRKDPLPGPASLSSAAAMATTPGGVPVIPTSTAQYTVQQSVEKPTTFFRYSGDWCSSRNDNLWGCPVTTVVEINNWDIDDTYNLNPGAKTIYDPCPEGWRMAPHYVFANIYHNGSAVSNVPWTTYGREFRGITTSTYSFWFPVSGARSSSDGGLDGIGISCNSWLASSSTKNGACLGFNDLHVSPKYSEIRAAGYSVRCITGT